MITGAQTETVTTCVAATVPWLLLATSVIVTGPGVVAIIVGLTATGEGEKVTGDDEDHE